MEFRIEKKAALVIERFFLMVKREVDLEIQRAQEREKKKKSPRSERRTRRDVVEDDELLEHVWLDTVDDEHVDVFSFSHTRSFGSRSQTSNNTPRSNIAPSESESFASKDEAESVASDPEEPGRTAGSVRHRASSPTMHLVMRHDYERRSVSNVRDTPKSKAPKTLARHKQQHSSALSVASLDDSEDRGARSDKNRRQRHGNVTAPSRSSNLEHFFEGKSTRKPAGSRHSSSSMGASSRRQKSSSIPNPSASRIRRHLKHGKDGDAPIVVQASSSGSGPSPRWDKFMAEGTSPRHGTIQVLNPYPDYPKSFASGEEKGVIDELIDSPILGEDFGMI